VEDENKMGMGTHGGDVADGSTLGFASLVPRNEKIAFSGPVLAEVEKTLLVE
jgi:hypothetical protein